MAFWQLFHAHALLHVLDIIIDPVPSPGVVGQVDDGIRGARVTIARLPHRARVENGARGQGHLGDAIGHDELGDIPVVRQVIHHRQVGVPHKAVGSGEVLEADGGGAGVEQVFPDGLIRAAMYDGDIVHIQPLGEIPQVLLVGIRELFLRPKHRLASVGIEGSHLDHAHRGGIVVALDALQVGELGDTLDAFVGVGAIAHQVAQAPDGVERVGRGQDGFEGGQIGVYVGEDECAHKLMVA